MLADSPNMEATDRSISPVMMMRVNGSAMMAISPKFKPAKKKVSQLMKYGETVQP
jgi:hypothetical protein